MNINFFTLNWINGFIGIAQGDIDGKFRAATFDGFNGDIAVHSLDDIFSDSQTKTGAAVSIWSSGIFLTKWLENLRQIFLIDTNTVVLDDKAQSRFILEVGDLFDIQIDIAAFIGEFNCVAKDINQHLPKLSFVADIKIFDMPTNHAIIIQALIATLPADDDINLFQHAAEQKFLVLEEHTSRFNPAHV